MAPACVADQSVCGNSTVLHNTSIARPGTTSIALLIDTVLYHHEAEQRSPARTWAGRGTGVALCYAGVSDFNGAVLDNHLRAIVEPLVRLFPAAVSVAFSTTSNLLIAPAVVERYRAVGAAPVIQQQRPEPRAGRGLFKNANAQHAGIEHCGSLIARLEAERQRRGAEPFGFAVRLRYDVLLSPQLGLPHWPIWHRQRGAPLFGLSKYIKGGANEWTQCPGALPPRRCIAQDVFLVLRNCEALGSAHSLFNANHSIYRVFRTPELHTKNELPEANLFGSALAAGVPMDVAWHPDQCLWMIAPWRTLFAGRCEQLRNATGWLYLKTHAPAAAAAARLAYTRNESRTRMPAGISTIA